MRSFVTYHTERRVATITLDSPHNRNALSSPLIHELAERIDEATNDTSLAAAVIAATGPVFCSGADLTERAEPTDQKHSAPQVMEQILNSDLPFVAKVHGPVRAGGLGIVASCDLAIAASSVSFSLPEVQLGLVPAIISIPLGRYTDPRALQRYALTGESFDAHEAARIGLISAASTDLERDVISILDHLRRGHPGALRATKRQLRDVADRDTGQQFDAATETSAHWFATDDAREGIAAVMERRSPRWRVE